MFARVLHLLPVAAAAALSLSASAGTVTLSNITGAWSDAIPAANAGYSGSDTANPQVRWGIGANQSGYNFSAVAGPLAYNLPPNTPTFALGTFQHLNFPIQAGSSITDVKLTVTTDVKVGMAAAVSKSFVFDFKHNETDNGANPCADGGANGSNPNQNGCADSVKVAYNTQSDVFIVDGEEYTLNVFGFSLNANGTNPFTEWWTAEQLLNEAYLVANITLKDQVGPPSEVPEPSTLALAGLGVLGLAASRRRKAR